MKKADFENINYHQDFIHSFLSRHQLNALEAPIVKQFNTKLERPHGDVLRWQTAVNKLPAVKNAKLQIHGNYVGVKGHDFSQDNAVITKLKALMPWRKGPFSFFGIDINTEWNSALKWQRMLSLDLDFTDKNILDIGCGNGFFMWQMLNQGSKSIIGVDPSWLFYWQFMLFQRYVKSDKLCFLPLGIEDLPPQSVFDMVLSMGILYHRKSPLDHLFDLKALLKTNGILLLETIVLPGAESTLLTPKDRYAGMRNVWMVPSKQVLLGWLEKTGFTVKKVSALTKTTLNEQRQSEWMQFHSLNQFLDEDNNEKTIEGHPAPYRLMVVAEKNK